jgi:hypothetical protein
LQVSSVNHIRAASGVAYTKTRGATARLNWTEVGPKSVSYDHLALTSRSSHAVKLLHGIPELLLNLRVEILDSPSPSRLMGFVPTEQEPSGVLPASVIQRPALPLQGSLSIVFPASEPAGFLHFLQGGLAGKAFFEHCRNYGLKH